MSHRSHRGNILAVDHVFYCNPSDQTLSRLPRSPNWLNVVYRELMEAIAREVSLSGAAPGAEEAFRLFDRDNTHYVRREDFQAALQKLGFRGDGSAALTPEEIDALIESADVNGDGETAMLTPLELLFILSLRLLGLIDYKEFCDRFWLASYDESGGPSAGDWGAGGAGVKASPVRSMRQAYLRKEWLQGTGSAQLAAAAGEAGRLPAGRSELRVQDVALFPPDLESGSWPQDYALSDHGIVSVTFSLASPKTDAH